MSLGNLVDRLSIVNMKIWHLQDWVHSAGSEEFKATNTVSSVQTKLVQLGDLNKERNRLMDEIDAVVGQSDPSRIKM
jgi:hypothetical protein